MPDDTPSIDIGRQAAIALAARMVFAALGLAGVVLFYRQLGKELLGVYYLVMAAGQLAAQVPVGLSMALEKRISEVDSASDPLLGGAFVLYGVFLAVAGVGSFVGRELLRPFLPTDLHLFGALSVLASLGLWFMAERTFSGSGKPGAAVWVDVLRTVFTLGLQVLLLLMGFEELGLVAGFAVGTALVALGLFAYVDVRPAVPTRETFTHLWTFVRWSVPNALTQNLYRRLDVLVLGAIVGSGAVGIYEPALRLTLPAMFVAHSVGSSLAVKASGLSSLGESVRADLENAVSYSGLFAVPILFGVLSIGDRIMGTVYGPSAVAGAPALVGLAGFQVLNAYQNPFGRIVDSIDRPRIRFAIGLLVLSINLPLAVVLAYEYGVVGVVAATVVSEGLRLLVFQAAAVRYLDGLVVPRPPLWQFLSGAVMFVAIEFAVAEVLPITGWETLVVVIGLGAVVYFGTLGVLSRHFRLTLRNVSESLLA